MSSPAASSELIVVIAPTGADAKNIHGVLQRAGLEPASGSGVDDAAQWMEHGIGALVVTEEALSPQRNASLIEAFDRQPPWSDIPIVIIASQTSVHHWAALPTTVLGARSNVTLVTRPLQASTLVAAVQTVLRARRRQYQIRDLLRERDTLLASLETRVQERTAKLQELVAELESFSYSVSHDLRAPLRIMAGYARVVLEEYGDSLNPDVRHYIERIARNAERMDLLTQDVLAYTRLSRGEMPLGPVDLEKAVEETIDQYPQLTHVRSSIVLRRPLAPVVAHGPSLVQALSNLLGNSAKFARPDVPLRIELSTRVTGDRVRVLVKDNGVGIEPANHAKIFRIFERAVGHDVPGTGIGLAIVKKAAERMGGNVGVSSELGKGATFWVELQKAPAEAPVAGVVPPSRPPSASATDAVSGAHARQPSSVESVSAESTAERP